MLALPSERKVTADLLFLMGLRLSQPSEVEVESDHVDEVLDTEGRVRDNVWEVIDEVRDTVSLVFRTLIPPLCTAFIVDLELLAELVLLRDADRLMAAGVVALRSPTLASSFGVTSTYGCSESFVSGSERLHR